MESSNNIKPLEVDETLSKKYDCIKRNIVEIKVDDDVRCEHEEYTVLKEYPPTMQDLNNRINE